ncbi:MAG: hypothetical protein U0031_20605 [Thermomicrobiales bacterium]
MDRRTVLTRGGTVVLALVVAARTGRLAWAQAATDFSGLGYPELAITVTDTGFDGVPTTTAAGRYLLTVTNARSASAENAGAVGFVSPTPAGKSAADFIQYIASLAAPTGSPAATPMAEGDAGGDAMEQQLPLWVYQLRFAGGVYAASGTAQAVIDLTPGEYVVWGDDPSVPLTPVALTVTGEFPTDVQDPTTDITATLLDFAIKIEGNLTAGKHLMKVQHQGAQPHFLDIEQGPDTMTNEQVQAALMGEMSGTPVAGGLSEGDLRGVFYSPTQSIGTVTFQQIDVSDGTFLAACFFPTAGTGVPHAMNGMTEVFSVTG